jgi:hypothetical protein
MAKVQPVDIQELRRSRLREWVEKVGGHGAVVRRYRLTASQGSYLSQVLNGYSLAERSARRWEQRLELDAGFLDLAPTPSAQSPAPEYSVAHPLSLSTFDDPPSMSWEDLQLPATLLPVTFSVAMPDDALAPNTPRGTPVIFDRSSTPPPPGVGVLVEDAHGARHIRIYRPGVGGVWLAWARNENYPTLDSQAHRLTLLAVARHRMLDGTL